MIKCHVLSKHIQYICDNRKPRSVKSGQRIPRLYILTISGIYRTTHVNSEGLNHITGMKPALRSYQDQSFSTSRELGPGDKQPEQHPQVYVYH